MIASPGAAASLRRVRPSWRLAVLALTVACGGSERPPAGGEQLGAGLAAALTAAAGLQAPWRCGAPDGPTTAAAQLTIGDRSWELDGHVLRGRPPRPTGRGPIVIGAIADAGGAAPSTIAALGRLRSALASSDVVLALGGMGTTQPELEATLGALADGAAFPVVALPGDLEAAPALTAAVAAMRARGLHVVDGRTLRWIELGSTTIGLIPGASAASRLTAGTDGCMYRPASVAAMLTELSTRPGVRIVATAEAPRIVVGGEAHGELALTPAPDQPIELVVHGPTTEAASRASTGTRGDPRGHAATPLTPGAADATARLPGPSTSTAGRLTITGTRWAWKPLRDDG